MVQLLRRTWNNLWGLSLLFWNGGTFITRTIGFEVICLCQSGGGSFLITVGCISMSQVYCTFNYKRVCVCLFRQTVGVYNYMTQRGEVLEIPLQTILFSLQCSRSPSAARASEGERERLCRQGWVLKFKTASPSPGVAVWRLMSYLGRVQLFHMHRVHISDIINFTTLGCCHRSLACHAPMISIP